MDETALLAIGILLEETMAEKVGSTGDLAFTEGHDADSGIGGKMYWNGQRWTRSVIDHRTRGRTDARERPLTRQTVREQDENSSVAPDQDSQ